MNRNEQIKNLQEQLKNATSRLNHSVQRDGTPDEYWAQNVVSLTAAIQALKAQDAAEPERPESREGELLDQILAIIIDKAYDSDRPMFEAVAQLWRDGGRATSQLECAALNEYRQKWQWGVSPNNLDSRREIICRVGLLMLEDVHPDCAAEEGDGK